MRHVLPLLIVAIALVVAFARPAPGGEAAAITIDPAGGQSVRPALLSEVKKLLASDAEAAGDFFGHGVAVSGDTIVMGAVRADAGGVNAGAAYVFQRNEGGADNWGEVKKLIASDAATDDNFGNSVAVSGDTIVVGAQGKAAYVFQRDQGGTDNWGEVKKLSASDAGGGFGGSVAVSGDTAVVGAGGADVGGVNAGAAYVFQRDDGGADNWGEVKKLIASDAEAGDQFGAAFHGGSVAVSGDTIVVGARSEDFGGTTAGAAYVFQRNEGGADNWGEVKKLLASDAEAQDDFGRSVAVSGDTIVVGAPREGAGGIESGAVYAFQRDEGGADNWGEVKKLTAPVPSFCAFFGMHVAVSGVIAIVGANNPCFGVGHAYVFQRNDGGADNWGQVEELIASDAAAADQFGDGVAVGGGNIVVGARLEDEAGPAAGAVYVFEQPLPAPTPTPTPTSGPPAVGGIVELVSAPSDRPQRQTGGSNSLGLPWVAVSVGVAALGFGIAVGVWRVRRRSVR